jgi:hypothetical protein
MLTCVRAGLESELACDELYDEWHSRGIANGSIYIVQAKSSRKSNLTYEKRLRP